MADRWGGRWQIDDGLMADRWGVDGRSMGGRWEIDGGLMADRWRVDGRSMGGGGGGSMDGGSMVD